MREIPQKLVLEREAVVEVRTDNQSVRVYKGILLCFTAFADKSLTKH
jgi:hypothetical protein